MGCSLDLPREPGIAAIAGQKSARGESRSVGAGDAERIGAPRAGIAGID